MGNERSGRRKDRNMNNRRIFIGLQHFAEGEGDGGAVANVPGNQTSDNGTVEKTPVINKQTA